MLETVVSTAGEIVSLGEAKLELGVWDNALDSRVRTTLEAARAHCERWSETTLRLETVRTTKFSRWPVGGCLLRWQPVVSIDSIAYRDADDAEQTLSTSLYRTLITGTGRGAIEWATDNAGFTLPDTRDRSDAITVNYTTGWQDAEDAPSDAKAAILLTMHTIFDGGGDRQMQYAEDAAKRLLTALSAPSYA